MKVGYTVIPVLGFLNGRKYTQLEENYLQALRPSEIDMVEKCGIVTDDSYPWRVRVYLDRGIIDHIEQEVHVALEGGYTCGWDLENSLQNDSNPGQEPPTMVANIRALTLNRREQ